MPSCAGLLPLQAPRGRRSLPAPLPSHQGPRWEGKGQQAPDGRVRGSRPLMGGLGAADPLMGGRGAGGSVLVVSRRRSSIANAHATPVHHRRRRGGRRRRASPAAARRQARRRRQGPRHPQRPRCAPQRRILALLIHPTLHYSRAHTHVLHGNARVRQDTPHCSKLTARTPQHDHTHARHRTFIHIHVRNSPPNAR